MSKNLKKHVRHAKRTTNIAKPTDTSKLKWKTVENVRDPSKSKTETGRNEPCPCGSGLKYKKCCMNNSMNKSK